MLKAAIALPNTDDAIDFEAKAIDAILTLRDQLKSEGGNDFHLDIYADSSFDEEFYRAIIDDIKLVPVIFIIVTIFTCYVFSRWDWVFSRSLLGFGAVASVLLSIMSGYGLVFYIGIPFTGITQILPYIMLGVSASILAR